MRPGVAHRTALAAAGAFLLATACTGAAARPEHAEETGVVETRFQMGTLVRIAVASADTVPVREAIAEAFAAIDAVVVVMSEWEPDSDVSRVNAAAGGAPVAVDPSLVRVLGLAERISDASGGAFDVTWAPLRHVWCFDTGCGVPEPDAVARAVALVSHADVRLDAEAATVALARPGMEIGLGGIAKGHAIARAAGALRDAGVDDFVIDAGGDVFAAGSNHGQPWRVGVARPRGEGLVTTVELHDAALVTSGDYERYFESDGVRYHHILDARTGMPARGLSQVTVLSDDPTVADALATAAFVLGASEGVALLEAWPGAEGLLVADDLTVIATSGWPAED